MNSTVRLIYPSSRFSNITPLPPLLQRLHWLGSNVTVLKHNVNTGLRLLTSLMRSVVRRTCVAAVVCVLHLHRSWSSVGFTASLSVICPFWWLDLASGKLYRSTLPLLLLSKSLRAASRLPCLIPQFLELLWQVLLRGLLPSCNYININCLRSHITSAEVLY